jgi:hypothetical protein
MSSIKLHQKVEVISTITTQQLTTALKAVEMLGSTMMTENALTKMMRISGQMKAIMKVICEIERSSFINYKVIHDK